MAASSPVAAHQAQAAAPPPMQQEQGSLIGGAAATATDIWQGQCMLLAQVVRLLATTTSLGAQRLGAAQSSQGNEEHNSGSSSHAGSRTVLYAAWGRHTAQLTAVLEASVCAQAADVRFATLQPSLMSCCVEQPYGQLLSAASSSSGCAGCCSAC